MRYPFSYMYVIPCYIVVCKYEVIVQLLLLLVNRLLYISITLELEKEFPNVFFNSFSLLFPVNTPNTNTGYTAGNSSSVAAAAKIKVPGVLIKLPDQRFCASNVVVLVVVLSVICAVVVLVAGDICCAGNTLCRC